MRSGLLSPEKDRLDVRRKQSMETFRQLGYVSSTMPWIEFWEKLLALAPDLFESRQALYESSGMSMKLLKNFTSQHTSGS
ncbi:uncharacterized protein IUM83_03237 [Phytophthora cinnamomi]|uniref:uncharacterized protein n=1 Tax=Phytophthora cinnamomi TaxID=4785 RepID=UPI00355A3D49|nr:hypothetical protein IUM83_03237 [Phytophthora cinnamomi]